MPPLLQISLFEGRARKTNQLANSLTINAILAAFAQRRGFIAF